MEEKTNEIFLDNSINPISIESLKIIEEQMINSVCQIYKKTGEKGTGFFCKIPFEEGKFLPMLITNNHILNQEDIKEGEISISWNNQLFLKKISFSPKRKKFTDKQLDITFIELLKSEIKEFQFLELDKLIDTNENFLNEVYKNKSIYTPNYQSGENVLVSFGMISEIINNDINHSCNTQCGSSGSPIISLTTHKVIGIHCANYKNKSFNTGTFIKFGIIKFQQQFKSKTEKYNLKKQFKSQFKSINTPTKNNKTLFNNISNRPSKTNFFIINKTEYKKTILNYSEYNNTINYSFNSNITNNSKNKKRIKNSISIFDIFNNNKKNKQIYSSRKSETKSKRETTEYSHGDKSPIMPININLNDIDKKRKFKRINLDLSKNPFKEKNKPKENEEIKNNLALNKKLKYKNKKSTINLMRKSKTNINFYKKK